MEIEKKDKLNHHMVEVINRNRLMCSFKFISYLLIFTCLLGYEFFCPRVYAGIPEPGMILYGQVRDGTGTLVTAGTLNWTFTPANGGDTIAMNTPLKAIEGVGETFSYSLVLLFETPVVEHPVSEGAIGLLPSPENYQWTAEVENTTISMTGSMAISLADRGGSRKIYIGVNPEDDKDGDGLPDDWEQIIIDHDPNDEFSSIDAVNPGDDFDGDGFSNRQEFLAGTDPTDSNDFPFTESFVEDFETGDFSRFPWKPTGNGTWTATGTNSLDVFAAQAPVLGDSQSASLETTIYCSEGDITFQLAVSSEQGRDFLEFYVDDQLISQWSGELGYENFSHHVSAGSHQFKWTYTKSRVSSGGDDTAWIDNISFPGSPDSDFDGMPDGWEIEYMLDPDFDDADKDPDVDGFSNLREYLAGTDPRDPMDVPTYDAVIEDFETDDFSRFPWVTSGYDSFNEIDLPAARWYVSDTRVHGGLFSAESAKIGNDHNTTLSTTMYTDGGPISFWCSVSSEDGWDKLFFYINGIEKGVWTGESPFSMATYILEMGMHTCSWVYVKDEVDIPPVGEDSCWIDDITFPGSVDSDGDGMPDGWEVDNNLKPLANDANQDPDTDGCNNKCEYDANTDPHVPDHEPVNLGDYDKDGDADGKDLVLFINKFLSGDADMSDFQNFVQMFGN